MTEQPLKRLLFVGFNRSYANRTFLVLIRALQQYYHIDFFGPGYQSDQDLENGPSSWAERHGPYDMLLFDHYSIMQDAIRVRKKPFAGDVLHFPVFQYFQYAESLANFIEGYTGKKLFLVNWDVYGISKERTEHLERIEAYIADCTQSRLTIEERQDAYGGGENEELNGKGFWDGAATDHWVHFVRRNRHKVLEVPHAIGLEQFAYTPLERRRWKFTVPGTSYHERKVLYRLLEPTQRAQRFWNKISDRCYSETHISFTSRRLQHIFLRYDSEIANSKLAFTSGSKYRTPVRKYFEIPALGTVPIGQIMEGFQELGFRDGENFIVAESPDAVRGIVADFPTEVAQDLATAARELILRQHSQYARANQLRLSFELIDNNSFAGSYWSNGEYLHSSSDTGA